MASKRARTEDENENEDNAVAAWRAAGLKMSVVMAVIKEHPEIKAQLRDICNRDDYTELQKHAAIRSLVNSKRSDGHAAAPFSVPVALAPMMSLPDLIDSTVGGIKLLPASVQEALKVALHGIEDTAEDTDLVEGWRAAMNGPNKRKHVCTYWRAYACALVDHYKAAADEAVANAERVRKQGEEWKEYVFRTTAEDLAGAPASVIVQPPPPIV